MKNDISEIDFYIFANTYIHDHGMSGGVTRLFKIIAKLNEKKHRITMVVPKIGVTFCKKNGVKANYHIISNISDKYGIIIPYILITLKSCINTPKISCKKNIIYSESDFLPNILPAFWLKLRNSRVKWIVILHLIAPNPFYDPKQEYSKTKKLRLPSINGLLFKIFQRVSIRLMKWGADKILVINAEIKVYLIKKNIDVNKIIIVDNGVDFFRTQKIKTLENIKYDAVFVGRYHAQKGIFDLIKIWELVCTQNENAKLAIIGGGSEQFRDKIKYEINKINLDKNIDLLGFLSEDEKIKVITSSKIFVCPSFYESWGIVIAEAMAYGLPVVAYDLPIYESIYENNILKIPIGNINQFADIVLKVINNPQMMEKMGRKGKKFIQKYDWDKICEREIEILRCI